VNSLASASTHDFYAPLTGRQDPAQLLRVGRWLTLVWTVILVAGAIAFRDQNTPVVQLALSIASLTYGSLLGTYILGGVWPRARQIDVIIALIVSIVVMSPVVLGAVIPHFPCIGSPDWRGRGMCRWDGGHGGGGNAFIFGAE